jgi:hypothetical protein
MVRLPPLLTFIVLVRQLATAPEITGLKGVPPGMTTSDNPSGTEPTSQLHALNQLLSTVPCQVQVPDPPLPGTVTVTVAQDVVLQVPCPLT